MEGLRRVGFFGSMTYGQMFCIQLSIPASNLGTEIAYANMDPQLILQQDDRVSSAMLSFEAM